MWIIFTKHICESYIKRINPNLEAVADNNMRLMYAKQGIISILKDANYLSDDKRGILLYSKLFNCTIIMQNRKAITLYPGKKSLKRRQDQKLIRKIIDVR